MKNLNNDYSVSVVIPTHNRALLLERAIKSVLNQTYPIDEIIVVSDASEDNTDEMMNVLCREYSNVIFHSYRPGRGGNYARNCGIQMSKSKYVAFLDDDDEWHPYKIEKQIDLIKNNHKIGLVCTAMNVLHVKEGLKNIYIPPAPYDCEKDILMGNCIGSTTTVMVKKELFDIVGMFDEKLPALQDYDMWIRLAQITKVGVVNEPCVDYYNYPTTNQISSNTNKYIDAEKMITEKYKHLIGKLSNKDLSKRICYFDMMLSKKGMRNGQQRLAIIYGAKAFWARPCFNSMICFIAAFVPHKIALFVRSKSMKKGLK